MKKLLLALLLLIAACEAPLGDDGCQELTECYQEQEELRNVIADMNIELQNYLVSISNLQEITLEQELNIANYQEKLDSLNESLEGKLTLPREQIEALFVDAEKLPLVMRESTIKDSIIASNLETIGWQDSTITLLNKQIALKDSLFMDLQASDFEKDDWYEKYVYAVIAFFSGIGLNTLTN